MKTKWNLTSQDRHDAGTVHSLFEECAEKNPNHIAVIFIDRSLTYGELNQKSNQLAHYLQKFGVKQDTLIGISMARSPELMIGMLGILKAGCAYLPLDETHPIERLTFILEDTKTPILITQSTSAEKFANFHGKKLLLDSVWTEISTNPSHNPLSICSSESLAYVIYTSGSTGTPKGVLIEHKSLVNYIKWFSSYSDCRLQNRIDFSSNCIFDMAITTSIAALALNLQVVICPDDIKRNIQMYLDHLNKNKINIIKLTPSYFKLMIQEAKNYLIKLPSLQSIILGGENLHTIDCIHWLAAYPKHNLFNEYGPTEATVAITQYKITKANVHKLGCSAPIGKPGFNMECMLVSDNTKSASFGETGELYISGMCLARGYLNQSELTSRQFFKINEADQRWYKTGDLCRYLPDGNIEFIRRIDDQVKIRGYRIELGEIEACLAAHPQIKDVVVITNESQPDQKQLVAYYIPEDRTVMLSNNELRHYLRQRLADYMIPANFVMLEVFPLTINEKLDKKALPSPTLSSEKLTIPLSSQTEQKISDIWKEVFHLKKIGVNANFFELGGHSLIAAQMISKIEKYLNKKIKLEVLYKAPTIKELAVLVELTESSIKNEMPISTLLNKSNVVPLSDFQFMFWISGIFEPKVKKLNIVTKRRLSGKLDISALTLAFESLIKKHEILSYRMSKLFPAQYLEKNVVFHVFEKDLRSSSASEYESKLSASFNELLDCHLGNKHMPLVAAKLFYLEDDISELQVGIPHFAFDDASIKILFSELSTAYLISKNSDKQYTFLEHTQYKDYVIYERDHLNQHIEKDINFWKKYLQDANLMTLPSTEIIHDMETNKIPYSTYLELPDCALKNMHNMCRDFDVSITDVVCASIALSLKKIAGDLNKDKVLINIIRSTRDNDKFDKLIGCFLNLDPIKVDINTDLNLIELSKFIQQSRIDTEPYQACSGMVKLACLDKNYRNKFFRNYVINMALTIYSALFKKLKLNSKMLAMYGHLSSLRAKRCFLIDVNLLNDFISPDLDPNLFGLKIVKTKTHQHNLSNIDNVLDICLFRNESMDKAYLVISGNLKDSFRNQIGNEINKIICSPYTE